MVVPNSAASQGTISALLVISVKRVLAAVAVGLLLWLVMLLFFEATVLLFVIANQLGFLLTACRFPRIQADRKAILAGVLIMLAAVSLGVCYDVVLRFLFGPGTPTIGPWSDVRRLEFFPACLVLVMGVLIGPAGDEWFFRAGLFGTWQAAGRPWSGALLSSGLFAAARLDPWNLLAYFGLGMLLCGGFRWTGSVLAVWTGHALLNVAIFVLLYRGYE
jgi:membrane protease YdiL (CAAX protease family)